MPVGCVVYRTEHGAAGIPAANARKQLSTAAASDGTSMNSSDGFLQDAQAEPGGHMSTDQLQTVLDRLGDAKREGENQWIARCPSHTDSKPSLSLGVGNDGRVLLHCHAGCEIATIIQDLGLDMSDLFPRDSSPGANGQRQIVKTYDYRDTFGILLFQVVRYSPKDFRQRKPVGADGWEWNVEGCERVLYRLQELTRAPDHAMVYVCEGEKDADRLAAEGMIATTNPGGAGKWKHTDDTPLHGRHIAITPHNDESGRKHAQDAASRLHGKAASVRIVELPGLPKHGDVSDWLDAGNDPADLDQLAAQSPEWQPDGNIEPDATPPPATAAPNPECELVVNSTETIIERADPIPLAEDFIDAHHRDTEGRLLLRRHRADFYSFAGACYQPLTDEAIDSAIYRHLEQCSTVQRDNSGAPKVDELGNPKLRPITPKSAIVREVRLALPSREVLLNDCTDPPCWLVARDNLDLAKIVPCRNGLLDLSTRTLHPLTPELFSTHALPFDYDPDAPDPIAWLAFLDQIWETDLEAWQTLQMWFGYCLCADTRQHKIMLIVGPPRSGKGTIGRILTALLGSMNVGGPSLSSLAMNFGLQGLLGKPLGIISDARLSGRADQAAVIERLLSISGEDLVPVDRKHKPSLSVRLPTRLMLLTNELPRLADPSGATASRFIVLTLTESWLGKEDHELTDKLLAELPGILNWAIDGWAELQKRGRFIQPKSSAEAVQELEDLSSPMGAFLRDRCDVGPGCSIERDALFAEWKRWCNSQGRDHPGTKATFGRDLHAALPQLKSPQPRVQGGGRLRMYDGVQIALDAGDG